MEHRVSKKQKNNGIARKSEFYVNRPSQKLQKNFSHKLNLLQNLFQILL